MRLLVVDVGNSSVKAGVFVDFYLPLVKRLSDIEPVLDFPNKHRINGIAVCSVVPEMTERLEAAWPKALFLSAKNAGIKHLYKTPETLGPDRLANALYVKHFIGAKSIVADVGTAITLDAIDQDGSFYGGVIFPGPKLQLQQLWTGTSGLPPVEITPVPGPVARDTASCMRAGVWWSISTAISGLAREQARFLGWDNYRLILTGGWSGVIREVIIGRARCSLERHAGLLGLGAWASELLR